MTATGSFPPGGGAFEPAGFRRGVAFLTLGALVVLGLVVDEGLGAQTGTASWIRQPAAEPEPQAFVTQPGTLSTSWYCAEGTSNEGGRADATVAVANAGETPLDAIVSVLLGDEPAVRRRLEVPPRSRVQVRIADMVQVEEPGVVVEVFGGDAAVEHVLRGAGEIEALPCVRRSGTQWLFGGGTTVKEARDVIALLNPFEDDAIVDMTFFTDDGPARPEGLQAFVVPGRSRVSVPVHEFVLRKEIAAAELITRTGRIVAERSIQWDGTTENRGMAVFPGANEAAESWAFPEGLVADRVFEDVWILNPGRSDTEVEIQPDPDGDAVQEPVTVAVPARSAVSYRVNDVVAAGTGHSLRVTATGDEDVVVAQEVVSAAGGVREGYTVVPGVLRPARRWLFPAGSADDLVDEWITVTNPGVRATRLTVSVLAGGLLLVPDGLADLEIAPLARHPIRLGDFLKRTDLPVVVEADRPVEVVRNLYEGRGVSTSPGIPYLEP